MAKVKVLERHPHPKFPRLRVELRSNSKFYQALTRIDNRLRQESLKTDVLATAFVLAKEWYQRQLKASVEFGQQHPIDRLTGDPTIGELYRSYLLELEKRKQPYAQQKWSPIQDFWQARTLATVTTQTFKEFYGWRRKRDDVKPHTLHKDVVLIRQILKFAAEGGLLDTLPLIPKVGTIEANPRPWLTKQEWKTLRKVSLQRIKDAPNARVRQQRLDLDDLMEFLVASMVRIGEVRVLRFSSCRLEKNRDGDKMLICEVKGKRGSRTVVAQEAAVNVYERRLKHAKANGRSEMDLIFPQHSRDAFHELLIAAKLFEDPTGFERNLKSLRATAISFFLLDHPEINLQTVARNAGTSVQMIDQFYAKRLTAEMQKHELSKRAADSFRRPSFAEQQEELARLQDAMRKLQAEMQPSDGE